MDFCDVAEELMEFGLQRAIAQSRQAAGPPGTGRCLYCDEPLPGGQRRWCDAGCRDDWERAERARKFRETG